MTQLVSTQDKVKSVRVLLERSKSQIAMALPRHLTADRLMRVAMTCIQRNPKLLDCSQTSLVGAIIQAAQLGLEPDGIGARAWLIPRKNRRKGNVTEAHFQIGYQGLIELARRSKEIASFEAREVYAGDKFVYVYGAKPNLVHVPCGETDETKISHVYAIAHLTTGRFQFEVMTRGQVEAHRDRYAQDTREDSAWATSWSAMAKKTVATKLCKFLPTSIELQTAVALAEADDAGLPQDLGAIALADAEAPAPAEAKPPSKLDALANKILAEQAAHPLGKPWLDMAEGKSPEAGNPLSDHPQDLDDERVLVLGTIDQLFDTLGLLLDERSNFWAEFCGTATPANADLAALMDLQKALETQVAKRAKKKA